jgi:hypothetical protein
VFRFLSQFSISRIVIEYLNLVLGNSDAARSYWESEFFESILRIYYYRGATEKVKEKIRKAIMKLLEDSFFRNEVRLILIHFLFFDVFVSTVIVLILIS